MTRTVADAALSMTALSRPDWRDAMSLPPQDLPWLQLEGVNPRALRIGLWLEPGWGSPLSPTVRQVVLDAAARLEAAGATVVPVAPFMTRRMIDGLDNFWRMRSWLDFAALAPERQALVLPYISQWIRRGEHLSAAEVFTGYSQIGALRDSAVAACQGVDFVLSPVSPDVAFSAEWASPLNDPECPFEHIAYTLPWNMSEQPAISVNANHTEAGLPVGIQFIGHRHDDLGVLRMAALWELLRPPQRAWPMDTR